MAETEDFDPGPWKGHDFGDAYKAYSGHVSRSYTDAARSGVDPSSLVPESLITDSPSPLVILLDVTGSMGDWPKTIFSKLPYLELEGQEYLGEDMEISFGAIGDASGDDPDDYPLQVRPFIKGVELKEQLQKLVIEGGGGSQHRESYELAAAYYARKVSMPRAGRPILIFIGDESLYPSVAAYQARKYAHLDIPTSIPTKDIFTDLTSKYEVYLIRKLYRSPQNEVIQTDWVNLLGTDHIVILNDPSRVVDVIFGILAQVTNRVEYFRQEIEGRQRSDQVKTVYDALKTVHDLPKPTRVVPPGSSRMHDDSGGQPTKSLL